MKTSLTTSAVVTTRDPKGRKFSEKCDAAYNLAELSEEEAQRVNEATGLNNMIAAFIEEHRHRKEYANEEVDSRYGYLSGYTPGKKSLADQIKRLKELFPGLGDANFELLARIEKNEVALPANAEGWFAIPNWNANPKMFSHAYSQAVLVIVGKLKETYNGAFHNYREGEIDEKHLRQSAKSEEFWKNLAEAQDNPDILLVPAQFGIRHRGRSVRRARVVMGEKEVGFGAFAGGCMLLTHEERLQNVDDLWIDLGGDEFSPDADDQFSMAPLFVFSNDKLEFGTSDVDLAHDHCGSASVFVPQ